MEELLRGFGRQKAEVASDHQWAEGAQLEGEKETEVKSNPGHQNPWSGEAEEDEHPERQLEEQRAPREERLQRRQRSRPGPWKPVKRIEVHCPVDGRPVAPHRICELVET